jgi:hypothetical protein
MWTSSTRIRLLFIFFFSLAIFSPAQGAPAEDNVLFDSSRIVPRTPDPVTQQKLVEDPSYRYDRVGPATKSMWDRFREWLFRKLGELFSGGGASILVIEIILITGAIVLIIFLLLKNNFRGLFAGKSAPVSIDFSEFEEDIHRIDFNDLINKALENRDYRKAVRLHFLKLLKEMTDKGLITWQIDKTNNDYSIELVKSKHYEPFRELSFLYEHIWYGDFKPDELQFRETISKFKSFRF